MAQKESTWEWLKAFLKDNISLVNIIAAALLVELVSGVMYYSAQNIIHRTAERLIEREISAIYLCIRNKLAKVEVTVDNMGGGRGAGRARMDVRHSQENGDIQPLVLG